MSLYIPNNNPSISKMQCVTGLKPAAVTPFAIIEVISLRILKLVWVFFVSLGLLYSHKNVIDNNEINEFGRFAQSI